MKNLTTLIGRVLLAHIFVLAGISKITAYAATQGYMANAGVPGGLLPLVIAVELGGGLALILGWFTGLSALALAGFSIVAALLFHGNYHDQMQLLMLMKDFSMAGGLLILAVHGPGDWSVENWSSRPGNVD